MRRPLSDDQEPEGGSAGPPTADPVEELLVVCLQAPPSERGSTVARVCSEHPELADALRRRMDALERTLGQLEPADPDVPRRLGDFRLVRRLGDGGMGVVYEAEQEGLERRVAIKLVRPEQLYFPRARERFRREVEAVGRLQHPGIVPVHTVGVEEGVPFFAMERFHGCSLAEALRALAGRAPESLTAADLGRVVGEAAGEGAAGAELPELFRGSWTDACARIAARVADALEHAHTHDIVHRDVKPSNVALTADGRVLLFDFGLTTSPDEERLTRSGAFVGTLPYMAPEQLRDAHRAGPRTDVYSLGVTLYELLTLQLPFEEQTDSGTQALILAGRPDPIRARNRRVARELEVVTLVAMDTDPGRRYGSAAAFARDLGRFLDRRPIEARPPGPLLRARRWVQRHPAVTTAVALGGALLVGTPAALFWQERGYANELELAYGEATAARERADRAADATERSLDFLTEMFTRVSPSNRPGPLAGILEMLELGADDAELALSRHARSRGLVQMTLGQLFIDFGRSGDAARQLELAIESFELDPDTRGGLLVSEAKLSLADALQARGDYDRSEVLVREQLEWGRAAGHEEVVRIALNRLFRTLVGQERYEESDQLYAELLALTEDLPASRAPNQMQYAYSLIQRGQYEEAAEAARGGIALLEELYSPPHAQLAQAATTLAAAVLELGELEEAALLNQRAFEMGQVLYGEVNQLSAYARHQLAVIANERGDRVGAEEHARAALDLCDRAFGPGNGLSRDMAGLLERLSEALDEDDAAQDE